MVTDETNVINIRIGKGKVCHEPIGPSGCSLSWFLMHEAMDWMLVRPRVTPSIKIIGTHPFIQMDGERHCESKVSYPRTQSGLEPGPLDPETSALTMRPPRLPKHTYTIWLKLHRVITEAFLNW